MKKYTILLAEDDKVYASILKHYLEKNDYEITLVTNGNIGVETFKNNSFNLCILDVMMPIRDGFYMAREIRKINKFIPIIFLTAKSVKQDMIMGYQSGADDYLPKPFDEELLLHKIRAFLNKSQIRDHRLKKDILHCNIGDIYFDVTSRELQYNHKVITLSPRETELLKYFCVYKNEVLYRDVILNEIWGENNYFTGRSMDVYITRLRKYLRVDASVKLINIPNRGYKLSDK